MCTLIRAFKMFCSINWFLTYDAELIMTLDLYVINLPCLLTALLN